MRIAFAGLRHGHIEVLYELLSERKDVEIVAACEPHAPTRERLVSQGKVKITHDDYAQMFADIECDALAVGDRYGRRGKIIIAGLEAGLHVISDKPICTSPEELERIAVLSRERNLRVGCQLDLRDGGQFRSMRRLVRQGVIGEVHTVTFAGQHPLMYGSRPSWYFEEGMHGGTINDIAIHAMDAIPWITGRRFVEVVAARVWNASFTECPSFQVGAQMLLRLDNDGGVMGDVSYLSPQRGGYDMPQYWRMTLHGENGVLETSATDKRVFMGGCGEKPIEWMDAEPDVAGGYFDSFLKDIASETDEEDLTTGEVLAASRVALAVQGAAEGGRTHVAI